MTDHLAEFAHAAAAALQAARVQGPGVGVLAAFDNGAYVQYQVHPELRGADDLALMAVEIGPTARLNQRQQTLLEKARWEAPQEDEMPNWWRLVGDEAETQAVAGQLAALLVDVLGVSTDELARTISR